MNDDYLNSLLKKINQPKFRLGQIRKAVFQDGVSSFSEITTLSKDLREMMEKKINFLSFDVEKVLIAKNKQSMKALLRLRDGNLIETVLISPITGSWSACISCQVGCQMGCRFCATGKMGFKRNLTAEEITDQVLFWKQYLKKNNIPGSFSNIVYMGMGEPFNNWDEVSASIRNLTDQELFGFGSRSISVSTAGIAEGIERMAQEFPQVNLAISLHFATDEKRGEFMPINKKDNLESLRMALRKYFESTKRKVFLEYVMLEGMNDSASDAFDLSKYIKSIGKLQLLHVNLIRYNATSDPPAGGLVPSTKARTERFRAELERYGIPVTIRKSLGEEIQGACGQLAGK
ncbi:MAG: 23S rRNA (adenine(2503)-C(2))-methyltransferase RlmN [Candidatus Moranbacteria bacterium]|nr:23S rRNA (adenine(2503)-C(2))-methyltransferase RlmN [Candidatus Moranbacteria bacterium]